jgi:hypothetical protein
LIALGAFFGLPAFLISSAACLQLKKENVEQQSTKIVTSTIADFLANAPSRSNGRIHYAEIGIARLPADLKMFNFLHCRLL